MIRLENCNFATPDFSSLNLCFPENVTIDGQNTLTVFPAFTDPHVHLRTPGATHKETWIHGAKAALSGGITRVLDMPNTFPATIDKTSFLEKVNLIDKELHQADIPLRYGLYLGVTKNNLEEIPKVKNDIVALKIFMGSSTGNLLLHETDWLKKAFDTATKNNLLVCIHAEDEITLNFYAQKYVGETNVRFHSLIRHREAAIVAVEKALKLTNDSGAKLMVLHTSTKEEISLIKQAKTKGLSVFCEVSPHHLYLTEQDYERLGGLAKVNPPLRTKEDTDALWQGIHDKTVDTIGSDHAPHLLEEKKLPFPKCPSGMPGLETSFSLMLNKYHEGKIKLDQIISLMKTNVEKIYNLPNTGDFFLVDLNEEYSLNKKQLKTKCTWSAFEGHSFKGAIKLIKLKNKIFLVNPSKSQSLPTLKFGDGVNYAGHIQCL